jgi:hypothetical protein
MNTIVAGIAFGTFVYGLVETTLSEPLCPAAFV